MRSGRRGESTLVAEVANVSANGFWLLLDEQELFVPFKQFPWFRAATIGQLLNVQRPHKHHLYWPDLDVDLAVESIEHPERYPLVSKARPNIALQRPGHTSRPVRSRATRQVARR
ncbi:MAG: DUF2442 domain-containing protein [Armatimonadetes bacterium]|nr:DUF2442 domain-containing protein [Armatimonadota bacterium]